jgi:hypothetical protein
MAACISGAAYNLLRIVKLSASGRQREPGGRKVR